MNLSPHFPHLQEAGTKARRGRRYSAPRRMVMKMLGLRLKTFGWQDSVDPHLGQAGDFILIPKNYNSKEEQSVFHLNVSPLVSRIGITFDITTGLFGNVSDAGCRVADASDLQREPSTPDQHPTLLDRLCWRHSRQGIDRCRAISRSAAGQNSDQCD